MSKVFIEESTLTNLADAVRSLTGPVKKIVSNEFEEITYERISKAGDWVDDSGKIWAPEGFQLGNHYDTITIPGAVKLEVYIRYDFYSSSYAWVKMGPGNQDEFESNSQTKTYSGASTLQSKTVTLTDTDTVTFNYVCNNNYYNKQKMGYWARVRGYDADGNLITETVPKKVFTENKMDTETMINNITNKPFYPSIFVGGGNSEVDHYREIDVSNITTLKFSYTIYPSGSKSYQTIGVYYGSKLWIGTNTDTRVLSHIAIDNDSYYEQIVSNTTGLSATTSDPYPSGECVLDVTNFNSIVLMCSFTKGSASYAYGSILLDNFKGE